MDRPQGPEEAAAVAELSELFGDAVSDREVLQALRARHGNLELVRSVSFWETGIVGVRCEID